MDFNEIQQGMGQETAAPANLQIVDRRSGGRPSGFEHPKESVALDARHKGIGGESGIRTPDLRIMIPSL